ncbi:MAG: class I SAM-dependent methyltransferase [Elusimicrobiota bacterium]
MICPGCRAQTEAPVVERYFDPIGAKDYLIRGCRTCGLIFSDPRESPGPDWYERFQNQEKPSLKDWRYLTFLNEPIPRGQILDVGCGNGFFLLMATEKGFNPAGFDFGPGPIKEAIASGLKDVRQAGFEFLDSPPLDLYDAATLFDVLEHASEPGALLVSLGRWVKPGGFLAVSVPNGRRPSLGGYRREGFDYPPFHFTRWTPESLATALERAGFGIVRFDFSPLPLRFFSGLLYWRVLDAIFPILKKLLLGKATQTGKTWTDLLAAPSNNPPRILSNPRTRQKLIEAGLKIFSLFFAPIEVPVIAAMRVLAPRRGRTLYCLARKK